MSNVMPVNFRWSFSQWETYDACPAKWKFKNVLKMPSAPAGPHAARGLDLHDRVERYICGDCTLTELQVGTGKRFTDSKYDLKQAPVKEKYIPIIDAFKDHENGDRWTEKKMAFDSEWYLTPPSSNTRSVLGVLDAVRFSKRTYDDPSTLRIAEWKSGKKKDSHADQRKLYAVFGLKGWTPERLEVTTYYLEKDDDEHKPDRITITNPDSAFKKLTELWAGRATQMHQDQICAPKPGQHCNYCDYAKSVGGPCKFG